MSIWPQRASGWHSSICRNQKWQCKNRLCNLNSINLGIHELDVVFNYIITIYTATEFALQIAEVLSSRTSHLHISYIMKSRRTSKWIWTWQLTKTSPRPLHNARHSHAQIHCWQFSPDGSFVSWGENPMRSTLSRQSVNFKRLRLNKICICFSWNTQNSSLQRAVFLSNVSLLRGVLAREAAIFLSSFFNYTRKNIPTNMFSYSEVTHVGLLSIL